MSVEVRLFGKLKEYASVNSDSPGQPSVLEIEPEEVDSVIDILDSYKIRKEEISHMFVNGEYSGTEKRVSDEDRVAIFPRDMGLLYKWYFSKEG